MFRSLYISAVMTCGFYIHFPTTGELVVMVDNIGNKKADRYPFVRVINISVRIEPLWGAVVIVVVYFHQRNSIDTETGNFRKRPVGRPSYPVGFGASRKRCGLKYALPSFRETSAVSLRANETSAVSKSPTLLVDAKQRWSRAQRPRWRAVYNDIVVPHV